MTNVKVSEMTQLLAADVAAADDYIPIIDASAIAALKNKRITVADLFTASGAAASASAAAASASAAATSAASAVQNRNVIINGGFAVAQRGTSFTSAGTYPNNDDVYLLDQWTLLADGNDTVDVSQNTATVPAGSLYSCALDVETANKKFGIIQFIEQKNAHRLFGGTATLSFKARKGGANATVGTMRAAVLAWDGTADTLTSDVVSAWGASGTNPTLVANWTYENTPADLTLTTDFQTFSITGISMDTASAKNIAVFLYYNNADGTVGDFIYITDVQLEAGSTASSFERLPFQHDLALCERYFEKSYNLADVPAAITANSCTVWRAAATHDTYHTLYWRTRKLRAPTMVFYNPVTGGTGTFRDLSLGANRNVAVDQNGECNTSIFASGTIAGSYIQGHWTASAEL